MSNPFQHAFSGQDNNFYSMTGHTRGRRPSYTSTHPAARANAFSNLLNPTLQYYTGPSSQAPSSAQPSGPHYDASQATPGPTSFRNQDSEAEQSGPLSDTPPSHPWATRNTPLSPASRAFSSFLGSPIVDSQGPPGFFIPSYLANTVYADKLEKQLKAKQEVKQTNGITNGVTNGTSTNAQNGRPSGSHRGVAHQIVERSPPTLGSAPVGELPTIWNRNDKAAALDVSHDGLEAKYGMPRSSNEREHEAASIRTNNPAPPQCGLYYFEVSILSKRREETTIGIGFSSKKSSVNRLPGWETESWGYHGDDGNTFVGQNVGRHYGPRYTTGDTVGCGINYHSGSIFYTKNGIHLGSAFREMKGTGHLEIYPTVGLKKQGEHIRANFGQAPFIYDIDHLMQHYKQDLWNQITSSSADTLVPGLDETGLIQTLVLQYLQHDGYVQTARAFAQETHVEKQDLCIDPCHKIDGPSIKDDEDASNRQAIRCAVLGGRIDRALELTNSHYPYVLKENEQVYFRLRCRKFIEMARKLAEVRTRDESASREPDAEQQMEIDDEDDNGRSKIDACPEPDELLQEMLDYGQALQMEFADASGLETKKTLQEAFALMAYANPLKVKQMADLMDRKGRGEVAEELNSAILRSLGKSRRAPLEQVWAQTDVLLDRLRPSGEEGAFVSLKDLVDTIPRNQRF